MHIGIDISYWQQQFDFTKVAASEISFAYIKATEGKTRLEPMAKLQASKAQSSGIPIGYYHFAHIEADKAQEEANFFAQRLSVLPSSNLIPVLDIETNKANMKPDAVTQWITQFIQTMEQLGHERVMIYSYAAFLNTSLTKGHSLGGNPLWLAQYRTDDKPAALPSGWADWTIWQYTQTGTVPGINGNVDMNRCAVLPLV